MGDAENVYPGPPVYVSGGNSPTVTPDPVGISTGSNICQFINQDPNTTYIIELWISSNTTRVPMAVVLPKNQAVALILDPSAPADTTINYNILVPGMGTAPTRGGHGIVVGSGMGDEQEDAA
jgi:hypothetical protein